MDSDSDRFVVISGCSSGGKSTLLAELGRRGHATVEEPGRRIVRQELAGDGSALPWVIGIGGHLAVPPLPHHRAYGSRTRRFDWVKLNQEHEVEGDRVSRSSGCAGPVGPPGVRTCARAPSVNRRRPLHGTWVRHDGAVRRSGCARSATAAKDTSVIFGGSRLPGL